MSWPAAEAVEAGYPGDFAPAAAARAVPAAAAQAGPRPGPAAMHGQQGQHGQRGQDDLAGLADRLAEGCGGFAIGPMALALPMGALREVVPLVALRPLPSAARGLVGAIDLRGVVLPVLDLRRLIAGHDTAMAQAAAEPPCVVIMVHRGHLLGLLADAVTGVFQVEPGSFKHLAVAGHASPVLAGSLRRADDGSLVNLLDPAALAALPDMPLVDDPEPARSRHGDQQAVAELVQTAVPMMLARAGTALLAIDAMSVHATLVAPTIERSVLAMGACRGVVAYLGQRVPVVDLLSFTGLGRLVEEAPRELLLMHCGADPAHPVGLVGLLVEHVVDVVGVERDATVPVPAFALPEPTLFAGALPLAALPATARALLADHAGAPQCLVLDGAALRASPALTALASTVMGHAAPGGPAAVARGAATAATAAASDAALRRALVTFDLAGEAAVPIEQLAEILPYRTGPADAARGGAMLGLVVDRGRSIPVLSLPALAAVGALPPDSDASVLVVQSGPDWLGFAVPRLRAIEPAEWEPSLPAHGLGEADALTHTLRSRALAQVGLGAEQRMLRVLDLASIAQALREQRLSV